MSYFSSFESTYKNNNNVYDKSTESENVITILSKKSIEKIIYKKFNQIYKKMPSEYNSYKISNIMFNDKTHVVSTFKEHLIMDDRAEFLKRYYMLYESFQRLPKFFEFYDLYSKIFPNYTSIEEGKYFYKNIQQKQRVINTIEKIELENKMNKKNINKKDKNNNDDKVFSTNVIDSLLNSTNDEGMEMLFNINKENMKKDDSIFVNNVNNIIEEINKFGHKNDYNENKNINLFQKKQINHIVKINNNKYIIKIKNLNCDNINNNINSIKKEIKLNSKDKNQIDNKKNKFKENKENFNILNLNTKSAYSKINLYQKPNSKNKNIPKIILMDKLENNYNKTRQKYSHNKKSFSHNISTSVKSKKEFSNSKQNKSLYIRRQNSMSDNNHNFYKKYPNGLSYLKNKKKKNEMINYKKELLKIDLSKSKLASRNNALNFSLSKISNNKLSNTNHNSFIFKSNKSNSKTNILNNTNNGNGSNKIHTNINYNFNILESYSRNKSFKNNNKIKSSATNKNSNEFSKEKNCSKNRVKYIKRNSNKIESLFGNTSSMLSYNDSKINSKINPKHIHLNSVLYLSNLTSRRESKKSSTKKKLIKEEILKKKFDKKDEKVNLRKALQQKYSFKNINNSKIIKKNNSVLKFGIEQKKINKKAKIKNIKINNFSKLFNVFIKPSYKDNNQFSKPQTERNRIKIKI